MQTLLTTVTKRGLTLAGSLLLAAAAVGFTFQLVAAQVADPCAKADDRLALTGRGDRDHDGLSDCRERKVLGTDPRDWDSDDDGVADSKEVQEGTDPTDADTDDDGRTDGDEAEHATNPKDADTDDDGMEDGDDPDPAAELDGCIAGPLASVTCPGEAGDGALTVLGVAVALTPDTEFKGHGVDTCEELAAQFASHGGASVEVKLTAAALVAREVELRDADDDGSPDDIDDDDDDDGTPDDEDDDDDDDEEDDDD
jgi:hypothetical protein